VMQSAWRQQILLHAYVQGDVKGKTVEHLLSAMAVWCGIMLM